MRTNAPYLNCTLASLTLLFGGFAGGLWLSTAHAQPNAQTVDSGLQPAGFQSDFNYQVTNLGSLQEAQQLMDMESKETTSKSICANRAEVWSFDIARKANVQLGKVFIHFTALGEADENGEWAYHVAPYVLVNGKEYVLDSGFGVFNRQPTPIETWEKYFGKSEQCVVLDPRHNASHLDLEKNNMPSDWITPLTYKSGACRQYPTTEGICYIRKVPMYYTYPINVYAADLYYSGKPEYEKFIETGFKKDDVIDSCKQAMTFGFKLEHSCKNYLGFGDDQTSDSHHHHH